MHVPRTFALLVTLFVYRGVLADESAQGLTERASAAARAGDSLQAVTLATRAIQADASFAAAYYLRGREQFRLGRVTESVDDFDKYVELVPRVEPRMWERGISYYYAQKYKAGAQQFALYQTYHDNDVENSVWRYLCVARSDDTDQARATMLPIRNDTRVPMMQIYEMFRGQLSPAEVIKAAQANSPGAAALNQQLFYAHLYVGLYHEAHGRADLARHHITTAAEKHRIGHYMWDVAHIHAELLSKDDKADTKTR